MRTYSHRKNVRTVNPLPILSGCSTEGKTFVGVRQVPVEESMTIAGVSQRHAPFCWYWVRSWRQYQDLLQVGVVTVRYLRDSLPKLII